MARNRTPIQRSTKDPVLNTPGDSAKREKKFTI